MEKHRIKSSVKSARGRRSDASSVSIPVEDVAVLFRCGKCHLAPFKPPVYSCRNGHLTCTTCCEASRVSVSGCHKCKEPLWGRNYVLEEVLRSLPIQTCAALTDCSAPLRESRSEQSLQKVLQDPSHLEKLEKARLEAERRDGGDSTARKESSSVLTTARASHMPVLCPYPCGRIVTCSGMFPHFEFHHPEVLVSTVRRDTKTLVDIDYADMVEAETRCLAFLVVRLDDDDADINFMTPANLLKITKSQEEMKRNRIFISTLNVGRTPLDAEDDSWFLTVWGTSLYHVSPVSYTLCASNDYSPHSVSFTGPLVSLHDSQDPGDVLERGDCLLISPGLLREMRFGESPLRLTITYHSDRPFPLHLGPPGGDACSEVPSSERNLMF